MKKFLIKDLTNMLKLKQEDEDRDFAYEHMKAICIAMFEKHGYRNPQEDKDFTLTLDDQGKLHLSINVEGIEEVING